jgi:hypothetical protein
MGGKRMNYFVYAGYVSPDASDDPCYKLHIFDEEEEVIKFRKEFYEDLINEETGEIDSNYSNIIFSIFRGTRMKMEPLVKVLEWKLVDDPESDKKGG